MIWTISKTLSKVYWSRNVFYIRLHLTVRFWPTGTGPLRDRPCHRGLTWNFPSRRKLSHAQESFKIATSYGIGIQRHNLILKTITRISKKFVPLQMLIWFLLLKLRWAFLLIMMLIVLMDFNLNWMTTGCGISQMATSNALTVFAILKLVTQISIRQRVH